MTENKNTPAFPRPKQVLGSGEDYQEIPAAAGLTKREYFAAKAMQGLLSTLIPGLYDANTIAAYAYEAVKAADYLLKELSTPQP